MTEFLNTTVFKESIVELLLNLCPTVELFNVILNMIQTVVDQETFS